MPSELSNAVRFLPYNFLCEPSNRYDASLVFSLTQRGFGLEDIYEHLLA